MELKIHDPHEFLTIDFGKWLVSTIRSKLIHSISKYNFARWDNFLNTSEVFKKLYVNNYKTETLIIFAANNIVCKRAGEDLVVRFNNTKWVPGFDRVNLYSLLKTINYGTLDVKSCPIFTDVFKSFKDNIQTYVNLYYGL